MDKFLVPPQIFVLPLLPTTTFIENASFYDFRIQDGG